MLSTAEDTEDTERGGPYFSWRLESPLSAVSAAFAGLLS